MADSVAAQKALVIFKPDGLRFFGQGVKSLAASLARRGISFRFSSPVIASVNPNMASKLWVEQAPRFDVHRRYMSAGYSDPRITSAPIAAMVVEARKADLIPMLRSNSLIGPTNLETALKSADTKTRAEIERSLRFQLSLGSKSRNWPFPKLEGDPMYNRLHCSATPEEAEWEIAVVYSPEIDGERIPLSELYQDPQAYRILAGKFERFGYRNFGQREAMQLAFDINSVRPLLLALDDSFYGTRTGTRTVVDFGRNKETALCGFVLGVCGDTASGKTSIVMALKEAGYRELVLDTDREPRVGEQEGVDYSFKPQGVFLDALAQGRYVGVDRLGSTLYGLDSSLIHPALIAGAKTVVSAGPNTLAGLRLALPPGTHFGAVFVDCAPETLQTRLVERGRENGSELAARLARVRGTRERYAPRLPEFDLIVHNKQGQLEACVGQTLEFAGRLERGAAPERTEIPSTYKMTPQRRFIQVLFERFVLQKVAKLREMNPKGTITELEKITRERLRQSLTTFLEELTKQETGRPYLIENEEGNITIIVDHLINIFATDLQMRQDEAVVQSVPRRIGRLWHYGSREKAHNLFEIFRSLRAQIPDDEFAFIIGAHDLGKVVRWFNHGNESHRIVSDYSLPEFLGSLSAEQREMITLVVRYHQSLPDCSYSFTSWESGVMDMFRDPEVRKMLSNPDGSVNIQKLEAFVVRLKYMSVCDTAGSRSEAGGLRKLNAELYFGIADKVADAFKANSSDYEKGLARLGVLGEQAGREYLPVMPFCFDPRADERANGFNYYWELITRSKDTAVAQRKFTEEEWQTMLHDFGKIDTKYSPMLWWSYFTEAQTDTELHPGIVPPTGLCHFYVLIDKIARQAVSGFPADKKVHVWFYDKNGIEVANMNKEKASAQQIHDIFKKVAGFQVKGNKTFFTGEKGDILDEIEIEIVPGDKSCTFKIKHTNLDLSKIL